LNPPELNEKDCRTNAATETQKPFAPPLLSAHWPHPVPATTLFQHPV
jgi:hypothetical protein